MLMLFIAAALAAVLIALLVSGATPQSSAKQGTMTGGAGQAPGWRQRGFVFVSNGKLFYQAPGEELREIQSPYARTVIERIERQQQLHGWKEGTAFGGSFPGRNRHSVGAMAGLQATSVQFSGPDRILYFLQDDSMGGLFEYDLAQGTEKRLLHRQHLQLEDLRIDPDSRRMLCAQRSKSGASHIVAMDCDGNAQRELTSGDTIDTAPAWVPGQPNAVLFQSSGIARSPQGYPLAFGPASIQMADTAAGSLTTVLEDPRFDFLQPRVGANGFLYFIRRPYEAPRYGLASAVTDLVLFPFRVVRALVHYLNFFSLMYTRKPLITAAGPEVQADLKDVLIKGKRLDAQAALRSGARLGGVPSLVPSSWQLMCRSPDGEEQVLATHVASFDLATDDTVVFSNGYGVFGLDGAGAPRVLLRDKLIAEVTVAPVVAVDDEGNAAR